MSDIAALPRAILVTGAAGQLGREVTQYLAGALQGGRIDRLRLLDIAPIGIAGPGIETVQASLAEREVAFASVEGMDAVIHFAGIPTENEWDNLIPANIAASAHLWDAAVAHGVDRILFASSNHAVGMYPVDERIDHTAPPLPDSRYGLTKAFGEELGRLYAHKTPLRSYCMRIGSSFPAVTAVRHLKTYQSFADMVRMVEVGLTADYRFEIVYGLSDIPDGYWDNSNAFRLGYAPADRPEDFVSGALDLFECRWQGGSTATDPLPGITWPPGRSRDSGR
ncbi:NAD(P)-dependent oxidoreductase [Mesorhizobium sp. CAU 1741]|uniref:NAD-dependent epimerase/dehydratase family protein n=1 Tax=Mesorhizobium sp. CAU 1741 TaxID=3140366 RepID=UPI00325AADC6